MKPFLYRCACFSLIGAAFVLLGVLLPATPRATSSLLFAERDKNTRLETTEGSRIILVGGSNLSFGVDSEPLEKTFNRKVVNTGIHASIGLKYMLENTSQYVKNGDIVIVAAEYSHYFRDYEYVSDELLRTVFDVNRSNFKLLSNKQILMLIPLMPRYGLGKFKPNEYHGFTHNDVYSVTSFNEYGDVHAHWDLPQRDFDTGREGATPLNLEVIRNLETFQQQMNDKGALLLVTFPCIHDISYNNDKKRITELEQQLRDSKLTILGNSENYKFPAEMIFDTPFHLTKKGVHLRTQQLIKDLTPYLSTK